MGLYTHVCRLSLGVDMLDTYDLNQLQTILSFLKSTNCKRIKEALAVTKDEILMRATEKNKDKMPKIKHDPVLICKYHNDQHLTYHHCSGGWHECPICHWSPEMT